jgi:uncharacterized coiled-coil DUF342 family protein
MQEVVARIDEHLAQQDAILTKMETHAARQEEIFAQSTQKSQSSLHEINKLVAEIDYKLRLARGEDGFDG